MSDLMTVGRLCEMFEASDGKLGWKGVCHDCNCDVIVSVFQDKDNLVISGGAVYEPTEGKFFLKCDECFKKDSVLRNFQEVECWSRVVGYYRPVGQWNDGKQAEFSMRKNFDVEQALSA